jgi:hypothetical protein
MEVQWHHKSCRDEEQLKNWSGKKTCYYAVVVITIADPFSSWLPDTHIVMIELACQWANNKLIAARPIGLEVYALFLPYTNWKTSYASQSEVELLVQQSMAGNQPITLGEKVVFSLHVRLLTFGVKGHLWSVCVPSHLVYKALKYICISN